jgi:hypothetical protein
MRLGNGPSVYEIERCFRSMKKALLNSQQDLTRTVSNIGVAGGMESDSLGSSDICHRMGPGDESESMICRCLCRVKDTRRGGRYVP